MVATPVARLFDDDGAMSALVDSFTWESTSLGPRAVWPEALVGAVRIMLVSLHPMAIYWGDDLVTLYNDAFAALMGPEKHPGILGQPMHIAFGENWADVEAEVAAVMAGNGASWHENMLRPIWRNGRLDEAYWTYSYTPLFDSTAPEKVAGLLVTLLETTHVIKRERRVSGLLDLTRRAFEQAPGFMGILIGSAYRFEVANHAVRTLIGTDDIVGRDVVDILPAESWRLMAPVLDRVMATGEVFVAKQFEIAFADANGIESSPRLLDFVLQPIVGADGAVSAIFVQGQDVTVEVQAEQRLRESERRFREMSDNAPVLIWTSDAEGRCSYQNRRWLEYFGLAEPVGGDFNWPDFVHPDDRAIAVERLETAKAARAAFQSEYRLRRHDGTFRWVIDVASPRFAEDGEFLGYVGSVIDIQDRLETEAQLQKSEQRFKAAVSAVQGVLWTNDANGEMRGPQPGWQDLTGQTEADCQGYGWARAIHPDDTVATIEAWQRAVDTRTAFVFEHRVRVADGHYRHYSVRAIPTFDSRDAIQEWVGIHTDVTDQRRAAQILLGQNEILEKRVAAEVAERSRATEALRQSQKLDALGRLTGGISHDFNNMLSVVMSSIGILNRRLRDQDELTIKLLAAASDATMRASALTKRLLAFSRHQPLLAETVDANALISGMADLLQHALGVDIRLELELAPDLRPTYVDCSELENALLNLAVNARDAMAGSGTLKITTRNVNFGESAFRPDQIEAGDYVVISVSDTGRGMPADLLTRVIEPFFTTKPKGQGTGLGLSQIHGFVKQSEGAVELNSVEGEGTTVTLYLPRSASDTVAEPVRRGPQVGAVPGDPSVLVLVVDDDLAVLESTTAALRQLGYAVLAVASAAEAVNALETIPAIAVVLTDLVMPDMNGTALLAMVRQRWPDKGLAITTGFVPREAMIAADLELPLLRKPYDIEELGHCIATAARRRTLAVS